LKKPSEASDNGGASMILLQLVRVSLLIGFRFHTTTFLIDFLGHVSRDEN
jgi:hypothetical protein